MANSQQILEIKLDARNRLLKSERRGVTIQIRKDGFTLRAYLPSKTNPESDQTIQQRVPINLKADIKNLDEAERLAKRLSDEKIGGSFKWENWQKKEEEEVIELKPASRKVGDILKRYEKYFWSQEGKDKTNESNQQYWYQIQLYINKLEKHQIFNTENIFELGNTFPKASKKKSDFAKYCLLLGKFAEISNLKKLGEWATATQQAYNLELKKRARPRLTDEEYFEIVKALRDDVQNVRTRSDKSFLPAQRQWGWALAAQFVFGARTSEVWSIKPFEEEGETEAIALFDDEQEQAEELSAADDPENQNEIGADADIALFGDEPDTEVGTEEESDNKADSDLLESMIETSRNKSVMPECFQCPKCDTEIVLPEAERMMGLCFCPECEELIDSNTAQAHIVEKEDAEESEGESISVSDETEESEDVALESPVEEESQPDAGSAIEDAAEEMEFWLDEVLPNVVDCVKCSNSLKLDDEEKMFGIYHCPYCKANINHAKGEVVQSIMGGMEEGGEEEEEAPKRKPIKINFQALKPFAAVLVFAATLFYGVIKTAEYYTGYQNQRSLLILEIGAVYTNMVNRQEIYQSVLSSEKNKVKLAKMEKMPISELKELQSNLGVEKEKAYAEWFEKKGKEIGQKGNEESNQLADQFRQQMEQFNIRMRLAKLDSHNLANAIGLSKFERTEGTRLVQGHINAIKKMLENISKHKAIEMGLVRNEVLQDLMNVQSKLENFEAKSARDAVSHLEALSDITVDLETYFPLAKSRDFIGVIDKPIRKREKVKEGSTPWNGEMQHWAKSKSVRDQGEWDKVVTEYKEIYKSLDEFHVLLKEVKNATLEFSELNHQFLEGATLQSTVDKFRNLDGVRELVSSEMEGRLDKIATLLNPDEPGTLAHQIRARQASGLPLNQSEIDLFYKRFYEKWEPFLIEKDWFSFQEMSSYYHLAKPRFSSISRATSADE